MIWRTCERFGLRPPEIKEDWHDNPPWMQMMLLTYNQIREKEEVELTENSGAALLAAMVRR